MIFKYVKNKYLQIVKNIGLNELNFEFHAGDILDERLPGIHILAINKRDATRVGHLSFTRNSHAQTCYVYFIDVEEPWRRVGGAEKMALMALKYSESKYITPISPISTEIEFWSYMAKKYDYVNIGISLVDIKIRHHYESNGGIIKAG